MKLIVIVSSMLALSVGQFVGAKEAPSNGLPSVTDVEQRVLDYRRTIHRGHFVLKLTDGDGKPSGPRAITIWFDGPKKNRSDTWLTVASEPNAAPHREINCIGCEHEGQQLYYNGSGGGMTPVSLSKTRPGLTLPIDPRLLGMIPETVPCLVRSHLESYIRQVNRKNPVLERDTWKGKNCWRISYLNRYDQPIRIWVVPEWGHAVVQIVHEVPKQGKVWLKSAVETDYKQTKNGVWFPSRCVYQREEWGKPGEGEVCDVEVVSVNEPLASKVFKLEGMGLAKGVIVMGPLSKDGETLCWNGQQLVPYAGKKPSPPTPPMSRSWPFYTASILSAFVAALSLFCYFGWRRRSALGS